MRVRILCVAMVLLIVLSIQSYATEAPEASTYLGLKIPELHFEEKPVSQIIEALSTAATKAEAHRFGFRGIAIVDPSVGSLKITMKLKAVPLGKALGYLADLTGSTLVEGDGLCVLYPARLPEAQLVSRIFEPSQTALRILKLEQAKSPNQTCAFLESFGIIFGDGTQAAYSSSKNTLYAKLPPREMEILKSLLALLDRGVVTTPQPALSRKNSSSR